MKKETFLGSISLTALKHETIIHGGQKGIFIPVEQNPAIFFSQKEDGSKVINLDIEVKPILNGKYGNTHLIKCNVGKVNREKYGLRPEQLNEVTPILGNLKRFEFEVRDNNPQQPQYQQQNGYTNTNPGDMPAEFDPNW